ncbi:MAG: tRNA-dihydrouridine synthase family protein [Deferribacteraceae bacterium]|jgi:nifR3 family TIM-barrel protein|nr:tRNA-dihydrouridine synthase family protein [Deferribacteraceae bacterium]
MNFAEELKKNFLVSAPMAGITSPPYRKLLRTFFDGIIYTEMTSVEGLKRGSPASLEFLDMIGECRPCVVQFFGGNHKSYAEAVRIAEEHAVPDGYDINMGCPVKKVLKTGGGAALLTNLAELKEIVRSLRRATEKEFSIKIRLGADEKNFVYKEVLKIAEREGANALVVHARTKRQMFTGDVNYEALAELASIAKIPIIGNGNIDSLESLERIRQTGVSGAMIARAAMRSPWIFKALSEGREPLGYLTKSGIYSLIRELYGYMLTHAGDNERKKTHYFNIIKKFSLYFSKGLQNSAEFRVRAYQKDNEKDFFGILKEYLGD